MVSPLLLPHPSDETGRRFVTPAPHDRDARIVVPRMTDYQAIADRVEIEALRGEFTDAAMMRDRARLASLFTEDGVLRMPNIPAVLAGPEEIRAGGERLQALHEFFVQTTTRARSGSTATPPPAAPTSRRSAAPSTAARG